MYTAHPSANVPDDSTRPANTLDAARRRGADLVLQGVGQRTSDQVRISYSIFDVKTLSQIGGDTVTGSRAEIFALHYFEGYASPEIANMLGLSTAGVAVTLHRTRSRLQKEIRSLLGESR